MDARCKMTLTYNIRKCLSSINDTSKGMYIHDSCSKKTQDHKLQQLLTQVLKTF